MRTGQAGREIRTFTTTRVVNVRGPGGSGGVRTLSASLTSRRPPFVPDERQACDKSRTPARMPLDRP